MFYVCKIVYGKFVILKVGLPFTSFWNVTSKEKRKNVFSNYALIIASSSDDEIEKAACHVIRLPLLRYMPSPIVTVFPTVLHSVTRDVARRQQT